MPRLRSSYNLLFKSTVRQSDFDRLYKRMPTANGVFKYTRAERFTSLDLCLREVVAGLFSSSRVLRVHDMGASSGVTSLELRDCLASLGPVSVRASDYFTEILRVRMMGIDVFFDVDHQPLQIAIGSVALPFKIKRLEEAARRRISGAQRRSLFHPKVIAAVGPTFVLARDDIFSPAPGQYDVVRIMNTLVPAMGQDKITEALTAIIPTVAEGGLLIIGRNAPDTIHASIFRRSADNFATVRVLGHGFAASTSILAGARQLDTSNE